MIKAATAKVGSCNSLTYNGGTQTLVSGGQYIRSYGNNFQKNAGTYSDITAYADDNHTFSDGSVTQKMTCSIAKATPNLNLSSSKGTITKDPINFTESSAQGIFTNESSDTNIVTVSPTKTSVVTSQVVTVTGVNNGTATIKVSFNPSDTVNYNIPEAKTYEVTVNMYHTLTVNPNGGVWNGVSSNSTFTQVTGATRPIANPTTNAYYIIYYNGNGGSNPSSTKAYRSFSGWSLSGASGKGSFSNGVYTFGTGNGTLTANYDTTGEATLASSEKSVTVTFDKNGTEAQLDTPNREVKLKGLGWYTKDGTQPVATFGGEASFTKNTELYAHWGEGSLELPGLTKNGYKCFWKDANSQKVGKPGDKITITSATTYYADCGERIFTCAQKGQTTSYLGKSWYTMSNASGYCELALNELSGSTGSWNVATTKLTEEYVTKGSDNKDKLLTKEKEGGFLATVSGNSVIDSNVGTEVPKLTNAEKLYWYQSGKIYNSTDKDDYLRGATKLLAGYEVSAKNASLTLISPTTIYSSCSNIKFKAGTQSFATNESSKELKIKCPPSGTFTGSIYQSEISTNSNVTNANANNVGIRERYFTNQTPAEDPQAHQAKVFRFYPCGGQYHGTLSHTLTAKSSTEYGYKNNHTGTTSTRQYSNKYHYVYAGKYNFGSSAGKTLDLHFDTRADCKTYNKYPEPESKKYEFYYRPHIKVRIT